MAEPKCATCGDRRKVSQPRRTWLGWVLRVIPCPDCVVRRG